jgi:hypothetical protein
VLIIGMLQFSTLFLNLLNKSEVRFSDGVLEKIKCHLQNLRIQFLVVVVVVNKSEGFLEGP